MVAVKLVEAVDAPASENPPVAEESILFSVDLAAAPKLNPPPKEVAVVLVLSVFEEPKLNPPKDEVVDAATVEEEAFPNRNPAANGVADVVTAAGAAGVTDFSKEGFDVETRAGVNAVAAGGAAAALAADMPNIGVEDLDGVLDEDPNPFTRPETGLGAAASPTEKVGSAEDSGVEVGDMD